MDQYEAVNRVLRLLGAGGPDGSRIRASFGPVMAAAFGADGTLYVLAAGADVAMGGGTTDVYMPRSADLGDSWEFTTIVRGSTEVEFTKVDGTKAKDTSRYNRLAMATHPTDPEKIYAGMLINPANCQSSPRPPCAVSLRCPRMGGRPSGRPSTSSGTPRRSEPGYNQVLPSLSVAPNGRVDVVWFDFRSDGLFNPAGTGRSDFLNETCWTRTTPTPTTEDGRGQRRTCG